MPQFLLSWLWLPLLLLVSLELLRLLELLALLELLLQRLPPSWVKVWPLLLRLVELRCLLLKLLLVGGHSVEVGGSLTPWHLLEPIPLLELLPGSLNLQPPLPLLLLCNPLLLLSNPLLLPHLVLPDQLVGDDL